MPDLGLAVTAVSAVASCDILNEMTRLMRGRQTDRPPPVFFSTGQTRRDNLFYEVCILFGFVSLLSLSLSLSLFLSYFHRSNNALLQSIVSSSIAHLTAGSLSPYVGATWRPEATVEYREARTSWSVTHRGPQVQTYFVSKLFRKRSV